MALCKASLRLKTRQLKTFRQHFFFRLSSFSQQVKWKNGQEHSFHVTPPTPNLLYNTAYLGLHAMVWTLGGIRAQDVKPLWSWFKLMEGQRIDRVTQRRVKGHIGWIVVTFKQRSVHHACRPHSSGPTHTGSKWVNCDGLPVHGGPEVDCSVPGSVAHH